MSIELYHKYRPTALEEMVGQVEAVKMVKSLIKKGIPHALLLTGSSGCGKTTLARILRDHLECLPDDFHEINAGNSRGINQVREIAKRLNYKPQVGKCRIWLIDEAGSQTREAQEAFLKILEDQPSWVYFMFCTTEPNKLIKAIHTRCTEIRLKSLTDDALTKLITRVSKKELISINEEIVDRIISVSDGSARKALVLLHQISELKDDDEKLNAVLSSNTKAQVGELYTALLFRKRWGDLSKIISKIDEEPETVRRILLACCTTTMLKGGKLTERANFIASIMRDHWFDCGRSGLVTSCFEIAITK